MKIGVIGAGFTGLAAAHDLIKKGHRVTIFEKDAEPGGLAVGYQEKEWKWSIEKHYHHWFTNDTNVLSLAEELQYPVLIKRPKTSSYIDHALYQLDSPRTLLSFPKLHLLDRVRMAVSLGLLRYNPFWHPLEKIRAIPYLKTTMGERGYQTIWEPLMINKLGAYADEVSLAWFWARIKKRTSHLAYPTGGYLHFARHFSHVLQKKGCIIFYNTEIKTISSNNTAPTVRIKHKGTIKNESFDKIIVTLPSFLFQRITPSLPTSYQTRLKQLKGIGAVNMILRLKKTFLKNGTYWLNMCDVNSPILAIVEHTNFMDKSHYNNEHIVYVGNYMPSSHENFSKTAQELLSLYHPILSEINPEYKKNLIGYSVFKAPFAQPIIPINYSKIIPPFTTPLKGIYLANMEQVYPWDRGTNYAVELGKKISAFIENN